MQNIIPIVKEPNKVLRKEADEVSVINITTPRIQRLILYMKETLKNTSDGVGLAAPQVGESLRIFIVSEEAEEIDRPTKESRIKNQELKKTQKLNWKYYVFINPQVKNTSRRRLYGSEGCLSIPGKFGGIARYEKITIEAYDETGKKIIRGASKFFARVLQHELDHLNGILFIDKAEKTFSEIIKGAKEKVEVIVSFLALLELSRKRFVELHQEKLFEDIKVKKLGPNEY